MNYPKVASIIIYASFFFLLLLIFLPFAQIGNFFIDIFRSATTLIILFSVLAVIITVLGTNFSMFNAVKVWPKRRERGVAVAVGVVTWFLLLVYLLGYSIRPLYISIGIFMLITLFLFILTRKYSSKSIGIVTVAPFFVATLINLFLYTFKEFGGGGYFYGIIGIAIELAVILVLIFLRKRQWANYTISFIFLGGVIYGILLEGRYFDNIYFYVGSFISLLTSLSFTTMFYTKFTHVPYSQFFKFGKNNLIGKLILILVLILFIVGFYLSIPSYSIAPVSTYMDYFLMLIFGASVFYFMNFFSSTKVTDAITFILIGGVAVYGLHFLISIAPPSIIGGTTPRFAFWVVLSLLVMYEPSFTLTNFITDNKVEPNFSITHSVELWIRRSKLLKGRNGLYKIIKTLSEEGGTANIYAAEDETKGLDVIIKIPVLKCLKCNKKDSRFETIPPGGKCTVCRTELDTKDFKEAIGILKEEIEALSFLNSPAVVKQLDHFDWDGKTYLVEEMVKGQNFTDMFYGKTIGQKEMLDLIEKALHGIDHAHMHGIIHRDLNTNNLMVTTSGDVKIIDFGTAKFKSRVSASNGRLSIGGQFGTNFYSPPESHFIRLIPNREPTFSYDIYSIGCIMYFMLTGKVPAELRANTASSIYPTNSVRSDFVRDLSSISSKPVLDIILKATQFYPENRYQSAFHMICAIKKIQGEFLVTNTEQAFSLPDSPSQPFSSEIDVEFTKVAPLVPGPSFNQLNKAIKLNLKSTVIRKQAIKYMLIYDPSQKQYKLVPGKFKLYYWYFEKDGTMVSKEPADTGVFMGRKIMLFSTTNKLTDVVLAYYRV